MFGMGLTELAVIALVAVLVFGPDRIPELAKQAGQMVKKGRTMANAARDELREELGPEYADLNLRDLNPKTFVRKQIAEAMAADEEEKRLKPELADRLPEGHVPPFDPEST